jgi:hypothetical protein
VPDLLNLRDLLPPAVKAHVYTAIGERESGKSYFLRYLLGLLTADGARRAVVHVEQPEATYPGTEVRSISEAEAHLDAACLVCRFVPFPEVARLVQRLRTVEPDREIVLVIDEVCSPGVSTTAHEWASPEVYDLLHKTRGVVILLGTQTVSDCPVDLRGLSDGGYWLFRMPTGGPGNGTRARLIHDEIRPDRIDALSTLPDTYCLHSGRKRPPAP